MSAQSVGLSPSQGALYSALFNITSGIGRIAFGFLADALLGVRPSSSVASEYCGPVANDQNLNSWTLALTTIALSSLLIWPNATDQALIIVSVLYFICTADTYENQLCRILRSWFRRLLFASIINRRPAYR
jgi:hypothetical protein